MIPPINLQEMTINIGLISSGGDTIPRFTTSVIARQLESVTLKFISSVAVGNWYITISVAFFFYSRGWRQHFETNFKIFQNIFYVSYWKSLKTSIREVLHGKWLSKTFPSSMTRSLSLSPPKYWSKTALGWSPMQKFVLLNALIILRPGLGAQASCIVVEFECTNATW